nr:mediator of RNA polymerase II transcription subunit 28-like [Zootoca vivipara]
MAASLSGMFGNQGPVPPPPPPLPPVAPGVSRPAGLLPPNPAGPWNPNSTLVDELEASFEEDEEKKGGEVLFCPDAAKTTSCLSSTLKNQYASDGLCFWEQGNRTE